MPLGQRTGEKSESRYCGVETEFSDDMPQVLTYNLSSGFDFVLAPLIDPSYRPSLFGDNDDGARALPFAGSDVTLSPAQWSSHVVGKISSWIDLDSEDEVLRADSEKTLKQEISWASHLSLQACLLPCPRGPSCGNYARCVNQILQGLNNMQLWMRVPLEKVDIEDANVMAESFEHLGREHVVDSWEWWNSFRLLCEHHSQLSVALDVFGSLPSISSLGRWIGEPVRAAILHTNSFLTNSKGYPCLSKRHQRLMTSFFDHSVQIVLSGGLLHNVSAGISGCSLTNGSENNEGTSKHPVRPYLEYIAFLYRKMDPLPEQEQFEIGYRDFLQSPLQPLMDNLEAQTYEMFEKDIVKYSQYQRAVHKALLDRVPDEKASTTTVLMVVGAGRGPLVRASLQAADETGRKLRVYAVEKNPNAVVTLHSLIKLEGWEAVVTVVSCDMRSWNAPEKADILVSELLGSFGDNELSPECLDGAQSFLKADGISIPSSYTSFLQPVTATKLYNDVKSYKDLSHFETAYVVKLHNVARLAPSQSVFTFDHPQFSQNNSNQRYKKLRFDIPKDTGSALVHGFAGYFDATLYKDVHLGIEPTTATPGMFSWFAIFFPLRVPLYVPSGSALEVHFWRCCGPTKVWYEWCVSIPTPTPIHNSNGRSYWVGLFLGTMAVGQAGRIAIPMAIIGILSFILGVIAENKKPALGKVITLKDGVVCKFPSDPTVALGSASFLLLFSTILGLVAVFHPYKGKSIPAAGLFRSTTLLVFFIISMAVSLLAGALMLWATAQESIHTHNTFHQDPNYTCPTAKTGLFGGAAFLALDSTLFWLICQMLTMNSRADYEEEEDLKGDYGEVLTTDLPAGETGHQFPKV